MELSAEIVVQLGKQVVVFGLVVLVIVVPLPFPFPSPFLSPGRDLVAGPSSPSSCDLPPPPSCSSSPRFFVLVIAFRPGIASPFCPWPPDGDENGSVLLSWTAGALRGCQASVSGAFLGASPLVLIFFCLEN